MKQLRSREMVRMLLDRGWYEYSQRGSHRKFKHILPYGRLFPFIRVNR